MIIREVQNILCEKMPLFRVVHIFICYDTMLKILPAIILIFLFASCASYHDGHKKGIFLNNDAPVPVNGPTSALIGLQRV
jgi:hypothetical protein